MKNETKELNLIESNLSELKKLSFVDLMELSKSSPIEDEATNICTWIDVQDQRIKVVSQILSQGLIPGINKMFASGFCISTDNVIDNLTDEDLYAYR